MLFRRADPPDLWNDRRARRGGNVRLKCIIDACGAVVSCNVLETDGAPFTNAAIECVSRWRYMPALLNGRAVSVSYVIEITWKR